MLDSNPTKSIVDLFRIGIYHVLEFSVWGRSMTALRYFTFIYSKKVQEGKQIYSSALYE